MKTILKSLLTLILFVQVGYAATVTGTITDSNSQPLAGVVLELTHESETQIVTSKANGTFEFLNAEGGGEFSLLVPSLANYTFSPSSRFIFVVSTSTGNNFTGTLGTLTSSPLDTAEFFVRQQYVDLLKREPDQGGLNFWASALKACTTQACRNLKRRDILCAFVASGDYQGRFTGTTITVCE